ncbi:8-oxo-dGTP pyrophosphatase MutT, NUDIX family [Pedococcus cremeus]|uniref:8-oxo-dGTP pyrophosphatase MutT, NUDIX family n=1 Tax=Pedococcus cremeus TaxID=587636 RepID=A0A1H9W5M5_9MICO|nr:NUDIX hydrolase [Pedococcus cremeus]SES29165.1 8-oxo-dGTP pyrophosphatase MutT, NUDIX family [Pedococcus cremeus]
MAWETRHSRTAYENPWIRVREDQVVRPGGADGVYGVVELRQPAVFVVALTDDDEVVLVTVDRHTTGRSTEVPAGGTDGEDPLVAAQRELFEESGYSASHWEHVGSMQALNGVCEAPEHVFVARGLTRAVATGHHEEGISEVRTVPFAEVLAMVRRGEITDGETVAALMYAALHLGRVH